MLWVIKASGTKEKFEKKKVINTCLNMDATKEIAEMVANKVYEKSYQGITTGEILELIFKFLGKYKPEIKFRIDLRKAISRLRPKPDFEEFIRRVLKEYSYEVEPAQIIRGRCIEHEIDGIVKNGRKTLYLEVKHHLSFHTPTPLEVPLCVWATFEDLKEGFKLGYNNVNFTGAMIVCNTKFSTHARAYALCKGIEVICWNFPSDNGLRELIREKKLYPITILKDLNDEMREKFCDVGIIMLKDLVGTDPKKLSKLTKIKKEKILSLVKKAGKLLET